MKKKGFARFPKPKRARSKRLHNAPKWIWRMQMHRNFYDAFTVWTEPEWDDGKQQWFKPCVSFALDGTCCGHGGAWQSDSCDTGNQVDWDNLPKKAKVWLSENDYSIGVES